MEEGLQSGRSSHRTGVLAVDPRVTATHLELGVQFVRRGDEEGLPQLQHFRGAGKLEEEHGCCGQLEEVRREVRDDPEGRSSAASQSPEQVRVLHRVGGQRPAVGEDDVHRSHLHCDDDGDNNIALFK